jgi:hypothetical protein
MPRIPARLLFRGPKSLMELLSFQRLFAPFDVFECLDVFAQTTLLHYAFLRNSSTTLREHVRLFVLRQ